MTKNLPLDIQPIRTLQTGSGTTAYIVDTVNIVYTSTGSRTGIMAIPRYLMVMEQVTVMVMVHMWQETKLVVVPMGLPRM